MNEKKPLAAQTHPCSSLFYHPMTRIQRKSHGEQQRVAINNEQKKGWMDENLKVSVKYKISYHKYVNTLMREENA